MRMNRSTFVLILVLLIGSQTVASADAALPDVIRIDSGPVAGISEGDVRTFLGIPYAAPPVGALRWKPPEAPAEWTTTRSATAFGPACPQPGQQEGSNFSEDCLYLNVWTPAKKSDAKLPVMVWIHGGGFNFGSASLPEYYGLNLARKGVVVVTINYRLGPLGFLVHPLLSKESARNTSGNYALLDQIAALKWVRRNIAAFGGDTENVTLFGQSAGSRSVSLLLISPMAQGLFHRAIAQSGGPIIGSEYLNPLFNGDMASVSKMGQELAVRLGCDTSPDVLAAMRSKSAREVIVTGDVQTSLFAEGLFFAPVFDGRVLPQNPLTAFSGGKQHDVPIIVGSTANEGTIYLISEKNLTVAKYQSFLKARFGDNAGKAFAMFPAYQAEDVAPTIDRFLTVAANAQPARFMAQSVEGMKSRAYLYHFTRLPDTAMTRKLKVHHGVDLAFVFGNMKKSDGYTDTDLKLAEQMMQYWVNFAKTGNPNGAGLPDWPAYERSTDLNLEFSDTLRIQKNLYRKESDFIDEMSIYRRAF